MLHLQFQFVVQTWACIRAHIFRRSNHGDVLARRPTSVEPKRRDEAQSWEAVAVLAAFDARRRGASKRSTQTFARPRTTLTVVLVRQRVLLS